MGVDWEGTLLREQPPNLLSYLPTALREYPKYAAGSEEAHDAMLRAGFARGSEFTREYHYGVYWDLTQRIYREELDHRYYRVVGGTHVDGLRAEYGDRVRPILPGARQAFIRLVDWVEDRRRPPVSATLPRPAPGTDAVNTCSLRRR